LSDLEAGAERLPDVKVLVLGNGRIGKTQICRRLRGEDYDPSVPSTHGILVTTAELPMPSRTADEEARLHLWDFGGQDLYHGTHALFMRTRSIFVLVWTPRSEDEREHQHGGMTFRDHPLPYWLDYVRHLSGVESPVLLVQNQCDEAEDEEVDPPVDDEALRDFRFRRKLHYSALNDRGRGALDDALQQAILWLRKTMGQAKIGKGRMKVKRKLEALRDQDAKLPPDRRKHRWLSQEEFRRICARAKGVSRPDLLLDYLHASRLVFYREGLFDDRIVLDQAWALEAVYAVFHRERCYRQLRQLRGRFTRTLLEALVWDTYSVAEQELFLSLMTSCGVCFVHRPGDREGLRETEYIAPDLLPGRDEVAAEIEAMWAGHEHDPGGEMVVDLPFLHPGVMLGLISQIGEEAGIGAVYWKYGVCLYEKGTRSHALIEQRLSPRPAAWSGQIAVSTRGGQALELLRQLREWVTRAIEQSGCRDWTIREAPDPLRANHPPKAGRRPPEATDPHDARPERALEFAPPPSEAITYGVSYAWNDESKAKVDELCEEAVRRGKKILRDTSEINLGDSFIRFMQQLGSRDLLFVILSDKYLKSAYCMYELLEVWRNCKEKPETFRKRVLVYRLSDAAMSTPRERVLCAKYWREQFNELDATVREFGPDLLGEADFKRYKLMQDFSHRVGDILALIADTLQPRDFDELKSFGLDDERPSAPSA
jgi:internalin A